VIIEKWRKIATRYDKIKSPIGAPPPIRQG